MRHRFRRSGHFRSADREASKPPSLRPLKHCFYFRLHIPELAGYETTELTTRSNFPQVPIFVEINRNRSEHQCFF
ncbi:protein of unknown function [Methylocaldum szegediense]|uniref:Uncharacterized protein n=1 Tax=Methylocaldum szegediense TaxID=73780 RepID=A0ABM9I4A1_9GAMM|nr:protein of unknown function [Methylocaldum szegediense]